MSSIRVKYAAAFVAATALAPLAQAQAAGCPTSAATSLTMGTVGAVAPGATQTYAIEIGAHEGVIVDLSDLKGMAAAAPASSASGQDEPVLTQNPDEKPVVRNLKLCDARGNVLSPQPGEVFDKGGSIVTTNDGERLRFYATAAGRYLITVTASDAAREILVRRRDVGSSQAPVVAARLGQPQKGITSSSAPMVFSFTATAGQWVQIKSTSEKDTLLRLAGPDRQGDYTVIAENDDSDGLNPMLRRKLAVSGTYYVQVDSLAEEPGEFDLTLEPTAAPKPPPPPLALRPGTLTRGKLADGDAMMLYALPVVAGHAYRVDLTTSYDGVVGVGVFSPLEPDDGGTGPDAGFTEIKSQDSNTSGTEKLNFTARSNGQIIVRVKSFGINETDGSFTLMANDLGG